MKVTLFAIGTRGDVEPCIGLAKKLDARGHEVRLAAYLDFRAMVEGEGVRYAPIGAELAAIDDSHHGRGARDAGGNLIKAIWHMRGQLEELSEAYWQSFEGACAGADVLLGHHAAPQVPSIGERDGIPVMMAAVMPSFGRSRAAPSPYVELPPGAGPALNRLSHFAFEQIVWQALRPAVNRWRTRRLGLAPYPFFGPYGAWQRQPILYGYSRHLLPPPADWPDTIRVTGFWETRVPSAWQAPPPALADFLAAGPPPVYVGFGSMPVRAQREHLALVAEALRRAKRRGLVGLKLGDESRASLPEHLHAVHDVPHDWLFPQTAGVVCHGGSGTVHRALRAGVPCAVYHHFGDQIVWGRRAHAASAGPPPLPRAALSLDTLTRTVEALTSDAYRRGAEALAPKMAAENGLEVAADAFEELAAGLREGRRGGAPPASVVRPTAPTGGPT